MVWHENWLRTKKANLITVYLCLQDDISSLTRDEWQSVVNKGSERLSFGSLVLGEKISYVLTRYQRHFMLS